MSPGKWYSAPPSKLSTHPLTICSALALRCDQQDTRSTQLTPPDWNSTMMMAPIQPYIGIEFQQLAGFMEVAATDEDLAATVGRRESSAEAMDDAVAAFEELYAGHSRLLLAFLSSRVKRDCLEDLHQMVWQKVWQYLPEQFKGGNFRAWMFQIARNQIIDFNRKKKPITSSETVESVLTREEAGAGLLDEERKTILQRCLQQLQQEMTEIVRGRLAGENYETISGRMNLAPARAHKLFFQAREQLSRCVGRALN